MAWRSLCRNERTEHDPQKTNCLPRDLDCPATHRGGAGRLWRTTSACTGACAVNWPPLRASGKPTFGSGVNSSLVATTTRSDGKPQVTYNGHPLYLYSGDAKAGDTNGEGVSAFGGLWYAVSPAGNKIVGSAPSTGY